MASTLMAVSFDISDLSTLPTYFTYTEDELAPLYSLDSPQQMDLDEVMKWDPITLKLIREGGREENISRIYAYLYTAQRDVAFLSYFIKRRFEGSLAPISQQILEAFFPHFKDQQQKTPNNPDSYSQVLAHIVMTKVKDRMIDEQRSIKPYEQKQGDQYWTSTGRFIGQEIGSWKPWFLSSGSQFRLPSPPPYSSPIWQEQIRQVKEAREHITKAQEKSVRFWAGIGENAEQQYGDWRTIANEYIRNHHVSLQMALLVRSILAMGIADAAIATYDSKYTYWVKRPSMMDSNIHPCFPNPNHPGYPSLHSTASITSAMILTCFFPQSRDLWEKLAWEAGMSRIWCGIHFPIDNEMGRLLGKDVGHSIIESIERSRRVKVDIK